MSQVEAVGDDAEALADIAEERFAPEGSEALAEADKGPLRGEPPSGEDVDRYDEEFRDFIAGLDIQHFSHREFLFLGGSHHAAGSGCRGLNSLPPKDMWPNLAKTAEVLDKLRERLGAPVRLNSIYRNEAYNGCLSGAAAESQHKNMRAADFTVADGRGPAHWRSVLLEMRDEKIFSGGIGIYNTFVHVDTRGSPADWDKRT